MLDFLVSGGSKPANKTQSKQEEKNCGNCDHAMMTKYGVQCNYQGRGIAFTCKPDMLENPKNWKAIDYDA